MRVVQFIYSLNMGGAETLVKEYALGLQKYEDVDLTVLSLERRGTPYEDTLAQHGVRVRYINDVRPICVSDDSEGPSESTCAEHNGGETSVVKAPHQQDIGTAGHSKERPAVYRRISNIFHKAASYLAVRKAFAELKPDVVHFHLGLSGYILRCGLPRNTAIVYTQHFDIPRWKRKYPKDIDKIRRIRERYPTRLIALNEDMKREMDEMFHTSDTLVLNNGIDTNRFRYPAKQRPQVRRELGLSADGLVIGHVGRFHEIKNHAFLLDVFRIICDIRPDASLLLVGSGETEKSVREKAESMGLSDRMMILHDRSDVNDLLQAMDIMIFPSFAEGVPLTLIEAQCAGIPILASTGVSAATKISNLLEFRNLDLGPENWAERVLEMTGQKFLAKYEGMESWDIRAVVGKLHQIYMDLIPLEKGL